jgi:hypothetical protein
MSPYSSSSSSSTSLMYTWRSRIIDVHVSQKRCIQAARRQSERRSRGPGAQHQVQSRGVAKRITQFPTAVALAANDADAADAVAGTPVVAHHRPLAASGRLLPLALHRPPFCASSALPLSSSSSSSSPSKRLGSISRRHNRRRRRRPRRRRTSSMCMGAPSPATLSPRPKPCGCACGAR